MRPFQEFSIWVRRAPLAERFAVAVAVAAALSALGWVIVPPGSHNSSVATGQGSAGALGQATQGSSGASGTSGGGVIGSAAAGSTGGSTSASPSGAAGSSGSGLASATGTSSTGSAGTASNTGLSTSSGTGCVSPPGSAPGVTSTDIHVAITLTEVVGPAANSTFNIPPPQEQQNDYQWIIDDINAHGGVACRKLVPTFYTADPADQNDLEQKCLDIAQSGVFAEIDEGAYADYPQKYCYPENHMPFIGGYAITQKETDEYYPYLFDTEYFDTLYKNTIFGFKQMGEWSKINSLSKVGFLYHDCYPWLITEFENWLGQAGVPSSDVETYDLGCPAAFASPSDLEQAVLKFRQDNVKFVTDALTVGDLSNFTTIAQQQSFKPKYLIPDDYFIPISYGSSKPDTTNFDGALAITANRTGEERTPGMQPTSGTQRCNAIFAAHGQPPVWQQQVGTGGLLCSQIWIFQAAVDHAPSLSQTALAAGLQATGSLDLSYPNGPDTLSGSQNTVWMQYWRVDEFHGNCSCWTVVDPTFHPSF